VPAACVTVNVRPAIVSVPVRDEVVGFAWMLNPVAPFPVPLAPDVTVMKDALLTAVHVQALVVVTVVEPVPPPTATD
jgi:hypothetical protein